VKLGYALLAEQSGPVDLIGHAVRAEAIGFDFEAISDSLAPWLPSQGHAPNAWPVLGAIAHATHRVDLMTFSTSLVGRYHPAVVAQLAGTVGLLCDGRFTLGLGTGDNVSEHAIGQGWPSQRVRLERLGEAIQIIDGMLRGRVVDFAGQHFQVEGARAWDVPKRFPAIGVVVTDEQTAMLAGRRGDAMLGYEPDAELVQSFEDNGGLGGPRIGQLAISYDPDPAAARQRAHDQFRWRALSPHTAAQAPGPDAVADAARFVRPEDTAAIIPSGPDLDTYRRAITRYAEAGYSHVAIAQIGGALEQEEFLGWAEAELIPALRADGLADQI
jgi:G6PDH family F420-dependent oxidoreductase